MKDPLFNDENEGSLVRKSADTIVNLTAAHWSTIRSLADDEEAKDQVKVSAVVTYQFGGKMPCSAVEICFAPLKVKDGASVFIDDPNQGKFPIDLEDKSIPFAKRADSFIQNTVDDLNAKNGTSIKLQRNVKIGKK